MAGVEVPDLLADLQVGFKVLKFLEIVPVLVDDRAATVLHRPDDQVQVPPAFRPFVKGVKAEEMADDFIESRLWVVEPEADTIAGIDVHPVEELVVEDARLLQDSALLVDVVLLLRHGAGRERRRPSETRALSALAK